MNYLKKHAVHVLLLFFLVVHLATLPQYGFTWDFHFHFFGGGKLLGIDPSVLESRSLPFVEPDPRKAWSLPYGPIMSIPPIASYLLLHNTLHILPADVSYHLPIVLWGVAGLGILYLFLTKIFPAPAALLGLLFLALTPRYFGDMHNNMKDIPSAVIFAVNMILVWRMVQRRKPVDIVLAALGFAVAFNVKINSVFIPIVTGLWIILLSMLHKSKTLFVPTVWYIILSFVLALLLWSVFWADPFGQLLHAYRTFGIGTNNIEVPLNGAWYCSGSTVPWYYPLWYLAIVTPLPILVSAMSVILFTVMRLIKHKRTTADDALLLMTLWLFVPLLRYLLPTIGVIDGIRHFEEVIIPIAGLSAVGYAWLYTRLKNTWIRFGLIILTLIHLSANIILYHPYQSTYFNELVGGATGALGYYDLDYWGTSQKEAVLWVNAHAPKNAKVHIVMAAAVAAQYLREDLLTNLNKFDYDSSDFVILLNRQSFLYRFYYSYEFLLHHTPVYVVRAHGAPLTYVYDNRTDNKTPRQSPYWKSEDPCIIPYWKQQ